MYSFPDLEPVCCSMSSGNYCFLTCIQISQKAGQMVWYSHLFKNFPQFIVIHTAWQIDGKTMKTGTDFILGGSKIIADCDCSHEIKRSLLLGRKVMNNLDSILKRRDITMPTKVHLVKAMVFPVVMYGCESWTI